MALHSEPIYSFENYTFYIPSYQRGYRWDKNQVNDLLSDLKVFVENNPEPNEYYSLQPVVVKSTNNKNEYILIDGQQRMTTINMLITYLNKGQVRQIPQYKFKFDRRGVQENFVDKKTYADPLDKTYIDNIDTFYMRKAYDFIEDWFNKLSQYSYEEIKSKFRLLFSKPDEGKVTTCVKVIWYELEQDDAMEAFDRLNYRRIKLTGTELVKALLLATNNPSGCLDENSINRAHEWDRIEKAMQDPFFWSMFNTTPPELSHIDFVINQVTDEINEEVNLVLKKQKENPENVSHKLEDNEYRNRKIDEDLFNYHVIDGFLRRNRNRDRSTVISELWKRIEDKYNQIRNWYDRPEWFNYIGLWRRLEGGNLLQKLIKLEQENFNNGKEEFTRKLKTKIGDIISKYDVREQDEKDNKVHILEAKELNYENNPDLIRNILLVFNIATYLDMDKDARFPFHLYDLYNETSLEHIHPQNITFGMPHSQIRNWCRNRISILEKSEDEEAKKYKEKNIHYWNELKGRLEEEFQNDKIWDKDTIVQQNSDEWKRIKEDVNFIDKYFGDMSNISTNELHEINNLALVDEPTNSALSNNYLNEKRNILNQRNSLRIKSEKENPTQLEPNFKGTFLMPATERVFSKYYTQSEPGDMRLWRKEDRMAYLEALCKVYDNFTN